VEPKKGDPGAEVTAVWSYVLCDSRHGRSEPNQAPSRTSTGIIMAIWERGWDSSNKSP
jgi:hypothetical protein